MVTEEIISESGASSNELENVTRLVSLLKKIDEDSQRNTSLSGRKGKRVLELKFKGTETSGESSSSVTNSSGG